MTIIEPAAPANQELDQAVLAWLRLGDPPSAQQFTAEELQEIEHRVQRMRRSLAELPSDFGPYKA